MAKSNYITNVASIYLYLCVIVKTVNCWSNSDALVAPPVVITPVPDDVIIRHVGDEIHYNCRGDVPGRTIYSVGWYQVIENQDHRIAFNHGYTNDLNLTMKLKASDSGSEIYCDARYTPSQSNPYIYMLSKRIELMILNDAVTEKTPVKSPVQVPSLTITTDQKNSLYVFEPGRVVEFWCRSENIPLDAAFSWFQAKDNIEVTPVEQLGGIREHIVSGTESRLTINVTEQDDDTDLYCKRWFVNEDDVLVYVKSDYVTLHVRTDDASLKTAAVQQQRRRSSRKYFDKQLRIVIREY